VVSDEKAKELEVLPEVETPLTDIWQKDGREPWMCCRAMERRYAKAQKKAIMLVIELESLLDANRNNPTDYYRLCRSARQTLSDVGRI